MREPARGAGRRMGVGGKAVPAPEIAVARNQALAGLEQAGEPRAIGALDHADLGEPARKLRRRLHVLGKSLHAVRQRRIGRDRPRRPSSAWRGTGRPARRDRRRARRQARSRSPSRRSSCRSPAATCSRSRPPEASSASWLRCRGAAPRVRRRRAGCAPRRGSCARRHARLRRQAPPARPWPTAACALSTAAASAARSGRLSEAAARPASILAISLSMRATRSDCSRAVVGELVARAR